MSSSASDKTGQIPRLVAEVIDVLQKAADEHALTIRDRRKVVAAVRDAIVPKGKPGRKPYNRLDKAYFDYKAEMRGLELYRRHIPSFKNLSRWRRAAEQQKLRANLRKRAHRERRKRSAEVTNAPDESSRGQTDDANRHGDNSTQLVCHSQSAQ